MVAETDKELTPDLIDNLSMPMATGEVLRVGPALSLYHARPSDAESTAQVAAALELFLDMAGPRVHYTEIGGQHLLPISETDPYAYPQFLRDAPLDVPLSVHLHGGAAREEAHPIHFRAVLPAGWKPRPVIMLSMGLTMAVQRAEGAMPLTDWVREACARVRPWHGSAGFAVTANGYWSHGGDIIDQVAAVLERFPGLDYPAPPTAVAAAREGPVAANWITVLADDLIAKMGGAEGVTQAVGAVGGRVMAWPGGLMLIASGAPQLGDSEAGLFPENYTAIGRMIAPLRGAPGAAFFPGGKTRDMIAFGAAWRARFDG